MLDETVFNRKSRHRCCDEENAAQVVHGMCVRKGYAPCITESSGLCKLFRLLTSCGVCFKRAGSGLFERYAVKLKAVALEGVAELLGDTLLQSFDFLIDEFDHFA